jgi:hypothetical protein
VLPEQGAELLASRRPGDAVRANGSADEAARALELGR